MASLELPDPEMVQRRPAHQSNTNEPTTTARSIHQVELERKDSHPSDIEKHTPPPALVDDEVARYTSTVPLTISPADDRRLRRLIDGRVLLVMMATYFLQALDKGTLAFGSIMGLPADTGLLTPSGAVGPGYAWLTTCVYLAVLVVEYPQNYVLARVPVAKYLGASIAAWGAILACHAACTNLAGLLVARTLLGVAESAAQPAFVLLSAMWYRRAEQAGRVACWYAMNGAQQIVGGLLAYCFSLIPPGGALASWQWLFLTYGVFSVFFGLFVMAWMPDSPMRARCFAEPDKVLMVERVRANRTGLQNRVFRRAHVADALADPQTWAYAAVQLCTTLPTSGLGSFANIIISQGLGFGVLQTQLLAMVLGAYIIVVLVGSAWLVKRFGQNCWTMLGFVAPSFVGTALLMALPDRTLSQHAGLLVAYYLTLSFWSAQTLGLSMMSRNVGGQTKKTVVVAINFVFWAAGNAIGPQVFLARDAPRYRTAFSVHLGCYSLLVCVIVAFRWHLVRQNRRRDALQAGAGSVGVAHDFEDLTDRENPSFRYVY